MANIIDGRVTARETLQALRPRIDDLPRPPGIAVVRIGEDPASAVYVRRKTQRAQKLGLVQREVHRSAEITQDELLRIVDELNADDAIDGILVQLPLPKHLDSDEVLLRIDPTKDVDGFHPENAGRLFQGNPRFVACTPAGVMRLLASADVALEGANAVVVGRSNIVGRPMAMLLQHQHATVTMCHSRTRDLAAEVGRADVVIAAVGRAQMVKGEWIKPGAVVIDVGINRLDDGSLVGDVDFGPASERARAITPVPGGVGPMTIAMLMENTVRAAELRLGRA